jgi:two-component system LytT family response regulator
MFEDRAASPLRAVVVDDEPVGREAVLTMLRDEPRIRVVGVAANGKEAVDVVRHTRPDLLFLDVQMPDRDGFAVLDALGEEVPRGLVFVTAHDEHAIRAFEVHALDYLLKPFGRPRFRAAVERALERLRADDALTLQRTLASMSAAWRADGADAGQLTLKERVAREQPRRLRVRIGSRVVLVDVDSIDWIEAAGDYVRLHTAERSHLIAERMHTVERLLDPIRFVRIHRSAIVNLDRVRELHRESDGGGTLVLSDGVRLRVARGRWDALESALGMTSC